MMILFKLLLISVLLIFIGSTLVYTYDQRKFVKNQIATCTRYMEQGHFNVAVARLRTIEINKYKFWLNTQYRKIRELISQCRKNLYYLHQKDKCWELFQLGQRREAYSRLEYIYNDATRRKFDDGILDCSINQMWIYYKRMSEFII